MARGPLRLFRIHAVFAGAAARCSAASSASQVLDPPPSEAPEGNGEAAADIAAG